MDGIDLKDAKARLRRVVLSRRNAMSSEDRRSASLAASHWACYALGVLCRQPILTQLDGSGNACSSSTIGLFWPIRSEIDCLLLERSLRRLKMTLALPVVVGEGLMEFRKWASGDDLVDAGFGTRAPMKTAPVVDPDILLVPFVGFDAKRNRLGYGGGYYDRYLEKAQVLGNRPVLVGYGFSCQKLDNVPIGDYDQSLDLIITDQGLV